MNIVSVIALSAAMLAVIDAGDHGHRDIEKTDFSYSDSPSRAKQFGFGNVSPSSGGGVKSLGNAGFTSPDRKFDTSPQYGYKSNLGGFGKQDTMTSDKSKYNQNSITGLDGLGSTQNKDLQEDPAHRRKVLQEIMHRVSQGDWRKNLADKEPIEENVNILQDKTERNQLNKKRPGANQPYKIDDSENDRRHEFDDFGADQQHGIDDFVTDQYRYI